MPEQHRFIRGMVSWIGLKQMPLLYKRDERFAGETKYPLKKMIRFAIDAITSFSIQPLRLASLFGLLFGVLGFLGIIYALGSWALGHVVEGWTSVILVVLVLGSVQLLVAGVSGEYLGRLYMETKRRPLFVIDQVLRHDHVVARQDSPMNPVGLRQEPR
jgi:dolichol-phosphate mannosyltransferase